MTGASALVMRSMLRILVLASSLEMRTSSTGHLVGVSLYVFPSAWLWAGTNLMCPARIFMSLSILAWPRIATDCHEVSSQTGRTRTAKNEVVVFVDDARACKTVVRISFG